jgi:hypothetical protein
LREQHSGRFRVLGVHLEDSTLEVLDGIGLAVKVTDFGEFIRDREALLSKAAVLLSVSTESSTYCLASFGEDAWIGCANLLPRCAAWVLRSISEVAKKGEEHVVGRRVFRV